MSNVTTSANPIRNQNFEQVAIWQACIVGEDEVQTFESFMKEQFGTRVQYLENIVTAPNKDGPGGRNDAFFAIHIEDVTKFAITRLEFDISWLEDVVPKSAELYPDRVKKYWCWDDAVATDRD